MDKTVNILGREYKLHYSLRSFFTYESITGKPFDGTKAINLYILCFSMIMSSNADVTLTFDEFIDACDDDPSIFQSFIDLMGEEAKKASVFGEGKKKAVEKR